MYLTAGELKGIYYPKAENMTDQDVGLYLQRANSYAYGILGGMPKFDTYPPAERASLESGLKAAIGLAFEFFTKGETAQVNPMNGNITEAAPAGYFQRPPGKSYQLEQVDKMLVPYAALVDSQNTVQSERGVSFL